MHKGTLPISGWLLAGLMLFASNAMVCAQSTVVCPQNIDFSFGNLANWTPFVGMSNCGGTCTVPGRTSPVFGNAAVTPVKPGRHTILAGSALDPYGSFPVVAPGGGLFSVRVAKDSANYSSSRVRYKISIPLGVNSYGLQFRYAAVLNDASGHASHDRPAFTIRAIDSATGFPLPCADHEYNANSAGFLTSSVNSSVRYIPWTLGSLNLSGQAGKNIFIEVTALGCGDGAHWAYGYFDVVGCAQQTLAITYCDLASGMLTLSAPTGYANYAWYKDSPINGTFISSGVNSIISAAVPSTPTFYYCVVTPHGNNGCRDTLRSRMVVDFKVKIHPDLACHSSAALTHVWASVIGRSGVTYSFTSNLLLSGPDQYGRFAVDSIPASPFAIVRATDSLGCFATDTLRLKPKIFSLKDMPDTAVCPGSSVTMPLVDSPSNLAFTYRWTGTNVSSLLGSTNTRNPVYKSSRSNGYDTLIVFVSAQGCETFDSIVVRTIDTSLHTINDTVCQHSSIMVRVVGDTAYSYSWSPLVGIAAGQEHVLNPIITADTTRTYTVTATHPVCPTNVKPLTITVEPNPVVDLGADTLSKCPGVPVQLNASIGPSWYHNYTFVWDGSSDITNPTTVPTTYTGETDALLYLAVTTPHGCLGTDSQWVKVRSTPAVALLDSVSVDLGASYQLNPASDAQTYRWTPATGLSDPSIMKPIATPLVSTRYFLLATNEFGCTEIDSIYIRVIDKESIIEVPNAFTPGIKPNDVVKVLHSNFVQLRYFRIYNRWGQMVFESKDINHGWDGTYHGEPQPTGVYVYIAEVISHRDEKLTKTGNISLLR